MKKVARKPKEAVGTTFLSAMIYLISSFPLSGTWGPSYALVSLSCGAMLLCLAWVLWIAPSNAHKLGIAIIVVSVLGLFAFGGFLGGFALGAMGGGLAATWKPAQEPRTIRPRRPKIVCPTCGYRSPRDLGFCGRCGASLKDEGTKIY